MDNAQISVAVTDDVWSIHVRGAVGDDAVRNLEESLDEAIAWGRGEVILDFSGGVKLGQSGIDAVIEARRALGQLGRNLVVVHHANGLRSGD